jgi:hypothetical protein
MRAGRSFEAATQSNNNLPNDIVKRMFPLIHLSTSHLRFTTFINPTVKANCKQVDVTKTRSLIDSDCYH